MVAGEADQAHPPLGSGLQGRLQRAPLAEDPIQLLAVAQVVELPEVQVTGPQAPEGIVEQPQRLVAGPQVHLRRQKHPLPRAGPGLAKGRAVVVLALLVGGRRVAVADAQAERLQDHRDRFLCAPGRAQDAFAAE